MMNLERAAMRGQLAEHEAADRKLTNRAEALHGQIRRELHTALIPVPETNIALVADLIEELVSVHGELAAAQGKIQRLQRELGD